MEFIPSYPSALTITQAKYLDQQAHIWAGRLLIMHSTLYFILYDDMLGKKNALKHKRLVDNHNKLKQDKQT